MRRMFFVVCAGVAGVAALAGCGEPPPPPTFPMTFVVVSDPGVPLAGVAITASQAPIGVTGPDGMLRVELTGPEGSPVPIGATCPEGYRTPTDLPTITLRQVVSLDPNAPARGLQVSIACPPTQRHGVVIVRAAGDAPQPDLPVLVDGREVARTDASGVAHVSLAMAPHQSFQVQLATAANPTLRPQDPRTSFVFSDSDDFFVFDQSFEVQRPRTVTRRRRPVAAPVPVGPVRIGPTRR